MTKRRPILTSVLAGLFATVMVAGQGLHLLIEASPSHKTAFHRCCPVGGQRECNDSRGHASVAPDWLADGHRSAEHDPSRCSICQSFAKGKASRVVAPAIAAPIPVFGQPTPASDVAPPATPAPYDARGPPLV